MSARPRKNRRGDFTGEETERGGSQGCCETINWACDSGGQCNYHIEVNTESCRNLITIWCILLDYVAL